ncbi:Gfo/Idh/MocA family protein [Larkinella soli]|uniref:Gfo/Idh/MocA family protein n=1 Tax=Larkinella soli TaxID=1770527 RepID=UPI000FFC221E|nr:Gfo/Idh/MocA family oxidoreductase [Larkinella soli]
MKNYFGKDRRNFLKNGLLAGLGLSGLSFKNRPEAWQEEYERLLATPPAVGKSVIDLKVAPIKQVKVAFIGIGSRGYGQLGQFNAMYPDKAVITAICDVRKERTDLGLERLKKKGQNPAVYTGKPDAWKEMVKRDDIDLVVICTPWADHVPMAVYAMQQGKHVAIEVPAAKTLDECWKLVNTAEETQRNCMMLENCCYGDEELWILNMVQKEVFGTLTYAEAAYIHNLRDSLFNPKGYYDFWRMKENIARDGNLYPTHGLGPVAQYLDILRGDRFEHLVSMSSLEASLTEASKALPADNPYAGYKGPIRHGDMNNCLIRTNKGRTVLLQHDIVTPRPYSRINALAGTKAYHEGYPSRLSIVGKGHEFLSEADLKDYKEKYRHPIWEKLKKEIEENGGHGGMDFVMVYRLIDCLNNGRPLDMDVYDAATWSVVTPLSEMSIKAGNAPIKFPDFTRGKWAQNRALGMVKVV